MAHTIAHHRTQSALPLTDISMAYHPSPGQAIQQRHSPLSLADTGATISIGDIRHPHEYSVRLVDLARNSDEDLRTTSTRTEIAAPPRVASPVRPHAGSSYLTSLSNSQPPVTALARKGSVLHSRARSLAAFVPKLTSSTTSPPEKVQSTPTKRFGDLFHGESAPIRLGPPVSPTKEVEESELIMDYKSAFTSRPALLRRRETGPQATVLPAPVTKPASSWFSRKPTNPVAPKQPQDEFATLNISSALFPNGAADPLDPTAFNNLLLNATNLLQRMQAAYREKVDYIGSIKPEQEAQRDEVEGAETRAIHLKKQLEDMSRRAQEQEETMKEMARELAEEKMRTLEAREAVKSIRLVSASSKDSDKDDPTARRRKRGSTGNASDSGFESDLDSIFSSHSGPPETPLSPASTESMSRMSSFESRLTTHPQSQSNASETLQQPKVVAGAAGAGRAVQRLGREGAAWATVDALRGENKELKRHLQEMQECLQGCIELVSQTSGP